MSAGHIVHGQCVDVAASLDHYYSHAQPFLTSSSLTQFSKVSGDWKIQNYSISTTGTTTLRYTANANPPTFPTCDTSTNYFDGLQLGAGILIAMSAAWAITILRRAL